MYLQKYLIKNKLSYILEYLNDKAFIKINFVVVKNSSTYGRSILTKYCRKVKVKCSKEIWRIATTFKMSWEVSLKTLVQSSVLWCV